MLVLLAAFKIQVGCCPRKMDDRTAIVLGLEHGWLAAGCLVALGIRLFCLMFQLPNVPQWYRSAVYSEAGTERTDFDIVVYVFYWAAFETAAAGPICMFFFKTANRDSMIKAACMSVFVGVMSAVISVLGFVLSNPSRYVVETSRAHLLQSLQKKQVQIDIAMVLFPAILIASLLVSNFLSNQKSKFLGCLHAERKHAQGMSGLN